MKNKVVIFIEGVFTGVILMILCALLVGNSCSTNNGISMLDKAGDCISDNSFQVMQVLDSGDALAVEMESQFRITQGVTVLFLHNPNVSYYDEQIINVPAGKCAKQIGTFKYRSNGGLDRTVPIVEIQDM